VARKKQTEKPAKNRDILILKAIDIFSEKGFKGTTIREVSRAAGVNAPTLYYYFGNKEGLWLEILTFLAEDLMQELRKATNEKDALKRFNKLLETHIRMSQKNRKVSNIFSIDEGHLTPDGLKIFKGIHRRVVELYVEELSSLEKMGYIKGLNINALAFNTLALINWQVRWFKPEGPMSLEDLIRETTSFVLYGILGSGYEKETKKSNKEGKGGS